MISDWRRGRQKKVRQLWFVWVVFQLVKDIMTIRNTLLTTFPLTHILTYTKTNYTLPTCSFFDMRLDSEKRRQNERKITDEDDAKKNQIERYTQMLIIICVIRTQYDRHGKNLSFPFGRGCCGCCCLCSCNLASIENAVIEVIWAVLFVCFFPLFLNAFGVLVP